MKKKGLIEVCGKDVRVQGRVLRIGRLDGEEFNSWDDPEAGLHALRKAGVRVDLFTFSQKPPDTTPKYEYPFEPDNLAVIPVSTFDQWWKGQIQSQVRVKVRKAEKTGITVREIPFDDVLLEGICRVYNENPVRQGKRFSYYGMNVEGARDYAGTFLDRSIFIGAFLGESMVGFAKLVVDKARAQACILHILSMVEHRDKSPTNALVAQSVRSCAERGLTYLTYGKLTYGKKQGDSLSHFKAANGFQRVDLPRYYVPLTPLGWAGFRLGLHHPVGAHIPESVATKLREWRKAWYQSKFSSVKEA